MKKLLLLFITTSFVLSQNLIEDVSDRYENGNIKIISYYQKTGGKLELVKLESYYENGQIEKEGNYKDGWKDDKYTYYNEDGSLKGEGIHKDGEIWDGLIVSYYENGQIKEEGNYKDGDRDGYKEYKYYEDGQIKGEGNFKDGELDGKWTYYNEDGSIKKVKEY